MSLVYNRLGESFCIGCDCSLTDRVYIRKYSAWGY